MTRPFHASSAMLLLGLLVCVAVAGTPTRLTNQDCRQIFPGANSCEAIRTLDSGVQWTEAWERGAWGPAEEFRGYVFFKSQQHEGKTFSVLVGVTNTGTLSTVKVKGLNNVADEFLAQFSGKSVRQSFALARTPEDLLSMPAMIRVMQDNGALSESIVQVVKDIALSANQVLK